MTSSSLSKVLICETAVSQMPSRSITRAILVDLISLGFLRSLSISSSFRATILHSVPCFSNESARNLVLKSRYPRMLTIKALFPIFSSFAANGVKSPIVSHDGFLSPVGVILHELREASPVTFIPQSAKKPLACAAYSATFSAPMMEYGCSAGNDDIAFNGSFTSVPSGSLPKRSNAPEEKCIALCPADMIAHFCPAF